MSRPEQAVRGPAAQADETGAEPFDSVSRTAEPGGEWARGSESNDHEWDGGDSDSGESAHHTSASDEPTDHASASDEPIDQASADNESLTMRAERDGHLRELQRVTAEFTNFRRQTAKRNTEIVAQAASGLARSLLPVLDACEAAVGQGVEGIGAVQSQLLGVLENEGLAVIGEAGETFDPNLHEAVAFESADDATAEDAGPIVAAVLRTGYAWKAKVLRPTMVRVKG